jgi:cold shock CspA family protein
MSSPSHQLTTTGRVVVNSLAAVFIYVALEFFLPSFPYAQLLGLMALALFATWSASIEVSAPKLPTGGQSRSEQQGSIKWFNGTKGFGFITGDDGAEVFVHYRNVEGLGKRSIKPGQRVGYSVVASDKGPQADNVRPL